MEPTLRIRRAPHTADLPLPQYMTAHAAGLDLYAANAEPITIAPGEIKLIPTGLFVEIPEGCEGQVRMRSGLALKHGLCLPNAPRHDRRRLSWRVTHYHRQHRQRPLHG